MKNIVIDSDDALHRVIRDHGDMHLFFRGEDSASYALRPKYGRYQASDARNTPEGELGLLIEFKRRAGPLLEHSPANDWEWLAVAQHFGLVTRLLDWTESPLVAAFFAVRRPAALGDRVVYALDPLKIAHANEAVSPFSTAGVVIYRPKHIAARITAQSGIFTVHGPPVEPFASDALERWVIPQAAIAAIYSTLYSYQINEASLFPDLDGLARHLKIWMVRGIQ